MAWNPADLTNVTLSNGNLTAVIAGGGVRSVFSASSGKYYWEANFNAGAAPGIGFATSAAVLSTVWSTPLNAALAYNGSISVNNVTQSGSINITPLGTTICVAVDITAKLVWWRNGAAGNWNGSGTANPATGTGGISISTLGTPLFAIVATNSNTTWIANFGRYDFVGVVPSGFSSFDVPTITEIDLAALTREALITTIPDLQLSGITREVLLASDTSATLSGIVREVLLAGALTTGYQTAVAMNMG